jgi:hypothetical protein
MMSTYVKTSIIVGYRDSPKSLLVKGQEVGEAFSQPRKI